MILTLSQRIILLRKKFSLTQKDLANRIGLSASVISGYETGERTPSLEAILSLSHVFKCSTDYLLGKEKEEPNIVLDTTGLTEEQIKALSELIKTMKH